MSLLHDWLASKNLTLNTLLLAGVETSDQELRFTYLNQQQQSAPVRYFDLAAWRRGIPYRFWIKGSKALNAVWWPASPTAGMSFGVLLCEGETDALAAVQSGCPFVVGAVPGAQTFEAGLWRVLELAPRVICAFDNDPAGNAGAARLNRLRPDTGPPLYRLPLPEGGDLRDRLAATPSWSSLSAAAAACPVPAHAGTPVPLHRPSIWKRSVFDPRSTDTKPDLYQVWMRLSPRTRREHRDGQGRNLREAWCPLHDDGENPGAWVGDHRWGCWVCGIESADVYELVAWVTGICPAGTRLTGDQFKEAKQRAQELA